MSRERVLGVPAGVMLDGQWLSAEEIRARVEEIAAKYGD
jgi:hypothetical protein